MVERWRDHAACKDMGFQLFFGTDDETQRERVVREREAKAVCVECSVCKECLEAADSDDCYGVWGGLTMVERRKQKQRLEYEEYMKRRFGDFPRKVEHKPSQVSGFSLIESRADWYGGFVEIGISEDVRSSTGVRYTVRKDGRILYASEEEADAWLYFASLTIT